MKVILQTPDFKAAQTLTDFVQENVSKLDLFSTKIIESRIILKVDKSDTKENKICEIKVFMPGNDLFASRQSNTFEEAVVQTIEALKHQLERKKTSQKKRVDGSIIPIDIEENEA